MRKNNFEKKNHEFFFNFFLKNFFEKKISENYLEKFSKNNFEKIISVALFFFVPLFFSCKKTSANLPVDEKNLVLILEDIHKAEVALDQENIFVKDTLGKKYYAQIFEKYHVSKNDFDSTMSILEHNPDHLFLVYKKVLKDLDPMGVKEK